MAGAQFAIDIAAQMTGGEYTAAQLDALTAELSGAGKGADFFSEAIAQVAADLSGASAASAAAASRLSEGKAAYRGLEQAAAASAKAVAKAYKENDGVVPPEMLAQLKATQDATNDFAGTLKRLEADAIAAAAGEKKLAQDLSNVKKLAGHVDKSISGNSESLAKLQGGLSAIGGPLGTLGSQIVAPIKGFSELNSTMGTANAAMLAGAVGAAALVAAVVALTAAAVAGVAAIASWAIGLADAARSIALTNQAADAIDPSLGALRGTMAAITDQTGVASAELMGLRKALQAAKVSADDMPAALEAAALAEAALGKGGADKFVEQIKAGKLAVVDFANTAANKFGGVVASKMLSLEAQSVRFKTNISRLFGGLNIEPALGGLQTLVGLFDENTVAGATVKKMFETIFQPLIDQAQNAAYVVEAFALGFLIGLMKLYNFLKPVFADIAKLFGFEDTKLSDTLGIAKVAGQVFAGVVAVLAVGFGALVVVLGLAAAACAFMVAPIYIAIAAVAALAAGVVWLVAKFYDFVSTAGPALVAYFYGLPTRILEALSSIWSGVTSYFAPDKWITIGGNIVSGIVSGVTGAGGQLVGAVRNLANNAINSAKAALGIHSPSKVFADEIGYQMAGGAAQGVDAGAGDVAASVQDMSTGAVDALGVASASPAAQPSAAQAPAPKGGVSLSGVTFNLYGVEGAADAVARISEVLTTLLEGDATALGGVPA